MAIPIMGVAHWKLIDAFPLSSGEWNIILDQNLFLKILVALCHFVDGYSLHLQWIVYGDNEWKLPYYPIQ